MKTFIVSGVRLARLENRSAVLKYWEERRIHDEVVAVLNAERPLKTITSDNITTIQAKDCYL